jgi:hypothetical protein
MGEGPDLMDKEKRKINKFKARFIIERIYNLNAAESFESVSDKILQDPKTAFENQIDKTNDKISVIFDPF